MTLNETDFASEPRSKRGLSDIVYPDDPTKLIPTTKLFWQDPDVRWLAGVNESDGNTWFNKEAFEELIVWLQLPALVKALTKPTAEKSDATLTEIFAAAKTAGYNVEKLLTPAKALPLSKVKDIGI